MRTRKIIVEVNESEHTRWQKSDSAILLAIERQLGYVMHGATAGAVPSVRAYYSEAQPSTLPAHES